MWLTLFVSHDKTRNMLDYINTLCTPQFPPLYVKEENKCKTNIRRGNVLNKSGMNSWFHLHMYSYSAKCNLIIIMFTFGILS